MTISLFAYGNCIVTSPLRRYICVRCNHLCEFRSINTPSFHGDSFLLCFYFFLNDFLLKADNCCYLKVSFQNKGIVKYELLSSYMF